MSDAVEAEQETEQEPTEYLPLEHIINSDLKPMHKLFATVRGAGVSVPDAAKGLGISREHGYRLDRKLSQESILVNPKMLSLGRRVAKTVYSRFLSADDPQHNRLAPQAVALVVRQEDAINPKLVRSQSLNVNVDLGMVDYDRFAAAYLAPNGDK